MHTLSRENRIGIIGSGAMGSGIAQIAATYGHEVVLVDKFEESLKRSADNLARIMSRLLEKERVTSEEAEKIKKRIHYTSELITVRDCGLVIEAIVEDLTIKRDLFYQLEQIVSPQAILATNTSSLSVISIASACERDDRVLGIHFFNPAPLMPLVEIIPSLCTSEDVLTSARGLIDAWGKTTVLAKDTPGFIVNRLARPFYGEALRIFEEGIAGIADIDWAMKELGGFRMGPFQLMDYIGNDVNYKVTETVFREFFYDPRYKPSFTQKRMFEAGHYGRKSKRGYYDYREGAENPTPGIDEKTGIKILMRIVYMLINEAADAVFMNIASKEDLDLAMTRGVNYPKGLLAWADELGIKKVYKNLRKLQSTYGEDRYRPSPILRRMVKNGETFFEKD